MSIDKGGRHVLLHRPVPYKTPSDPIVGSSSTSLSKFYLCEPTRFYYTTILSLHGSHLQIDAVPEYILENLQSIYIFPVSGKVLSTDIFPKDTLLQLNTNNVNSLVGQNVKAGDQLRFLKNKDPNTFGAQLVLRCALESDE